MCRLFAGSFKMSIPTKKERKTTNYISNHPDMHTAIFSFQIQGWHILTLFMYQDISRSNLDLIGRHIIANSRTQANISA